MSDNEYAWTAARYVTARTVLTCRERGLTRAPIPKEIGLPDNFTEMDVQAIAADLRAACSERPQGWVPGHDVPDTDNWVRLPNDPDGLIEALDRHASDSADRLAWGILRDLYNKPRKVGDHGTRPN